MDRYFITLAWMVRLLVTTTLAILVACDSSDGDTNREIILEIVEVQLSSPQGQPQQLDISVSGNVSSAGWTKPTLVPVNYVVPPQDGIYDFTFYATPPSEPAASVITPIEVTHRLNTVPAELKGIRIHSETNNIVMMRSAQKPGPVPSVINEITGVQLSLSSNLPTQLDVSVQGTVLSAGWSQPTLIAHQYLIPPQDGIYDFTFYATPPDELSATVITPINVMHRLTVSDNLKGIRIHSVTNNIVAMLEAEKPQPVPTVVNEITEVKLSILESFPPQLSIKVHANVDSEGWTKPILVAKEYTVAPSNGIYEFTFYATPPTVPGTSIITPITVTHVLQSIPDNLLGVKIISDTNNMVSLLEAEKQKPNPQVINEITDIKLSTLKSLPRKLDIKVTGNARTTGWSSPTLVPFQYIVAPQDGIYDFTFYATPPVDPALMVITPIEATHRLDPLSDNFKGIRVHSETNELVAMLDAQEPQPTSAIILSIIEIKITAATDKTENFDIKVKGSVNSGGWSRPMLIPFQYLVPPQDGIYDYTFYATPPSGIATGALVPIEAIHRLPQLPDGMEGIRIHSATNSVESKIILSPAITDCEFVNRNVFETQELYEGGATAPGIDGRIHWRLTFTSIGSFLHRFSDTLGSGKYYCNDSGLHLVDSKGDPYVPWEISVDIENQNVNLPVAEGVDRHYYLVNF